MTLAAGTAPIEAAERADVDGGYLPAERGIEGEHIAQAERQAENPLADGHGGEPVIDEVRRALGHPTPATRRTDRARFARERDEPLGVAGVAAEVCKTSGPDAARDELLEFAIDERRNAAAFCGRPQEGREMYPHGPVQYGVLGGARAVGTDARGRSARDHPSS